MSVSEHMYMEIFSRELMSEVYSRVHEYRSPSLYNSLLSVKLKPTFTKLEDVLHVNSQPKVRLCDNLQYYQVEENLKKQSYSIYQNSILCYKGVQYYFTHERRARRSPECVKKYARVAYVILCNSVCKVQYNECTHGDEKPLPPIRDGRVYRGKERPYGGKERVKGRRGRSPRRGLRGQSPPTG